MIVLFLVFWGIFKLFSTVASPVYIPPNSVLGFLFLHIFANICYLWSFWWWASDRKVWGDTTLMFWFAFPWWLAILSILSCAYWPSVVLWKNVYLVLLPIIFNRVVWIFKDIELYELLMYFEHQLLIGLIISISINILLFCRLSFHFANSFLCCAKETSL